MEKKQRANLIRQILDEHIPHPTISLNYENPYTLLIAVLLSAQCTDKRVNEVTPFLFARAKSPEEMTALSPQQIASIIRPCGLSNRKSKAIFDLSHQLIKRYQGQVPSQLQALKSLPGVGHKTASVVLSQAFGISAFPVDTHIHRLAKRWGLSSGKNVQTTEKDLKALFPQHAWNKLHLQIIFFGRTHCPARNHIPARCPICSVI